MKSVFKFLIIGLLALFVISHLPAIFGTLLGIVIAIFTIALMGMAAAAEAVIGVIAFAVVGIGLLAILGLPILALGIVVWLLALPFIAMGKAIFD